MARLAFHLHQTSLHTEDSVERGKADARRFEQRSLLDVQLGARYELAANIASRQCRLQIDAVRAYDIDKAGTGVVLQLSDFVDLERSRNSSGAEEAAAEPCALLVGPVDDAHPDRQLHTVAVQTPDHLGARYHAEGAVEPTPVRNRVEVATQHDPLGPLAGEGHPQISGGIDGLLDGDSLEGPGEPLPGPHPGIGPSEAATGHGRSGIRFTTDGLGNSVDFDRGQTAELEKVIDDTLWISRHIRFCPVSRASAQRPYGSRPDTTDPLADETDALPYSGEVPAGVLGLAKQRRKKP